MDGDHDNTGMRKNSIGALLSGARRNDDDGPGDVPHHESKPRAKSSLIEDLQNMDQGFDFSSMGTMGDFSGWGFGDSDMGSKNDDNNDDDGGGGGWNRRNNRGGGRDNRGRGVGSRDRGDRDGGGRGGGGRGGRGGRDRDGGGRDRDGGGRDRDGRNQSRDRGNRRDSFNNDSWKQNDDDDDRNDDGGWKKPNRERGGGGGGGSGGGGKDRGNIKKPGDWTCGACGFDNFASRSQCFDCGADKSNNKGGGGGGGGRRDSGFEDRGNFGNMAGGNASSLGKRNLPEDEPQQEPEKRSKLDADIYGPPMITSWTDIKEYDDDHDAQMFTEENQYLAQRFGEGVVRVRYTNQGVVGYYCMICEVEMTGEKPLDLHCNGMKHLKKKEKRDNPTPEPMQNQKKDKGSGSRPRLLPPEAFGRDGGNDRDRGDRGKDRDRQNRNNRSRFDDDSYDNRGGRGNMGRNRDRDNFGGGGGGGSGGGNWNQGNNRNDYGGNDNFNNRNRGDWRDDRQSSGGQFGGGGLGSGSGVGLTGGPTGTLLTKLADCSVKSEGDAELATNVIGLLLKSLKDYSMKKGESKVAELLLQAELKMSTIKALKVGLQYLSGSSDAQGFGGGMGSGSLMGAPPMGGMMGGGMGGGMGSGLGGGMGSGLGGMGSGMGGMGGGMGRFGR